MTPGQIIDNHYELLTLVGKGRIGEVWRARHRQTNRVVAIKFIGAEDREGLERLRREWEIQSGLRHPNIVQAFSVAQAAHSTFLIMPFIEGGSLDNILSQMGGKLPWRRAIDLILPVVSALAHAHRSGIIHRDIKPSNILVDTNQNAYLTDFGIAVSRKHLSFPINPAYASPEQIMESRFLDARSDLYSLGVVLYQMLSGQLPFEGDNFHIAQGHLYLEPQPLSQLSPDIPLAIDAIIQRALAKPPDHRISSADELFDLLRVAIGPNSRESFGLVFGQDFLSPPSTSFWKEAAHQTVATFSSASILTLGVMSATAFALALWSFIHKYYF
jgi:eukaryotic-like serine/threonine-protein kinase